MSSHVKSSQGDDDDDHDNDDGDDNKYDDDDQFDGDANKNGEIDHMLEDTAVTLTPDAAEDLNDKEENNGKRLSDVEENHDEDIIDDDDYKGKSYVNKLIPSLYKYDEPIPKPTTFSHGTCPTLISKIKAREIMGALPNLNELEELIFR